MTLAPREALQEIRKELEKAPTSPLWPRIRELSEQGLAYVQPMPPPAPPRAPYPTLAAEMTIPEVINALTVFAPGLPVAELDFFMALARKGREALLRVAPPAVGEDYAKSPPGVILEDFDRLVAWGRDYLETMAELLDPSGVRSYGPEESAAIATEYAKLRGFLDRVAPPPPTLEELAEAVRALFYASPTPTKASMLPQYHAVQVMLKRVPK